jgi:cytochrome c oxidase subunit 2
MTTRFKFTPDITTKQMRVKKNDAKFNYVLMCNKICGGAHYKMKMIVVVLSEKEYNKWMKGAQAKTFKTIFAPAPAAPAAPAAGADTLAVAVDTVAMPAPVK